MTKMKYAVGKNSKLSSAILLDELSGSSKIQKHLKLSERREVIADTITVAQKMLYEGEMSIDCFNYFHKIIMDEIIFMKKYCSCKKRNWKIFLEHLEKLTSWMELVLSDLTVNQPTYKEYRGY